MDELNWKNWISPLKRNCIVSTGYNDSSNTLKVESIDNSNFFSFFFMLSLSFLPDLSSTPSQPSRKTAKRNTTEGRWCPWSPTTPNKTPSHPPRSTPRRRRDFCQRARRSSRNWAARTASRRINEGRGCYEISFWILEQWQTLSKMPSLSSQNMPRRKWDFCRRARCFSRN